MARPKRLERTNVTDDGVLWPDPKKGPWYIAGHWVELDGKPECVGLEIWKGVRGSEGHELLPLKGQRPAGIGGTDLRAIPLASVLNALWEVQQQAEAVAAQRVASLAGVLGSEKVKLTEEGKMTLAVAKAYLEQPDNFQHPSRRSTEDVEHFKAVAAVYLEASRAPRPRPTKAVQDTFHVSHSTATKWVAKARRHGLIPTTTAGRPSTTTTKKKGN